jgi:hypothetical protein
LYFSDLPSWRKDLTWLNQGNNPKPRNRKRGRTREDREPKIPPPRKWKRSNKNELDPAEWVKKAKLRCLEVQLPCLLESILRDTQELTRKQNSKIGQFKKSVNVKGKCRNRSLK